MSEPVLRVVRGAPTEAEVVALVRALSELSATSPTPPAASRSRWSDPASQLRTVLPHGPGAWRSSAP
jgi:hypothetical protein